MLAKVPDDQYEYKPHPRSMVMKSLVGHLADLPIWLHMTLTTDELDFAKSYEQPKINNNAELMAYFEKRYNDGLFTLVPENETVPDKPWTLGNGDKIYCTSLKTDILRISFSQQIHHRAQWGVHLRLLNIPIPGSYGPSADGNNF